MSPYIHITTIIAVLANWKVYMGGGGRNNLVLIVIRLEKLDL